MSVSYFDKNTSKTWVGLSTDIKPTNKSGNNKIENGSVFYEMDTSEIFLFDKAGNIWWPQIKTEGSV